MKRSPVTATDLRASVIAVPPLARNPDLTLSTAGNIAQLRWLASGDVRTALYGGNANLYNIELRQYLQLLEDLPTWASDDMWLIPSIGPSYGQMLDHAEVVREMGYPTAMALPAPAASTQDGTATGLRHVADHLGVPLILYIKWDGYLSPELVASLVNDGVVCAVKYAIVREDPRHDDTLISLLERVDRDLVVSGMGERPAIVHMRDFGLPSFTSGSVCVAPALSTALLGALHNERYEEAERLRAHFLPLEDLRDGIHPVRVLHDAVTAAGIADMGPVLPLLTNLDEAERVRVRRVARELLATESQAPGPLDFRSSSKSVGR